MLQPKTLLPTFVQVELTYACNSACTFCYNPNHHALHDDDLTRRILAEVARYRLQHVQLIGGEISTLENVQEYIDLIAPARWRSLVTNGRIFLDDLPGRIDEIYLSLHGEKEGHERITRAKDSFDHIERHARRYVEQGIRVNCDTVLSSQNFSEIFDIASVAADIGMSTIFVNIFQAAGIGSYFSDGHAPTPEQIREGITQLLKARDELGIDVSFGTSTPYCLDRRLIEEDLAFTCGTGTWFASINPKGDVRICNQSPKSYGNILEDTLGRIWAGTSIKDDYRNLDWLPEPCSSCTLREDCIGGCRISDQGNARVDPLVQHFPEQLLSQSELNEVLASKENLADSLVSYSL